MSGRNVAPNSSSLQALAALLVKRWQEVPKRPSRVWLFDVSKQVAGGVFLHLWNILFSLLLVDLQKREGGGGGADEPAKPTDECALYFMEFFLDSFLVSEAAIAQDWAVTT
jgi:hypothetical protein